VWVGSENKISEKIEAQNSYLAKPVSQFTGYPVEELKSSW
jgi:hypothetical protein